jgi:glycosyltransferase involved in cell wall biosynthesis
VIFGSDQPAGFIAAVLGTLTRHLWKSKSIHIVYDSHGSRYKLAIDLNQSLIYRMISVFEDSLSVRVADLVMIPTYADKVIYAQYTRKKTKFIILPSLVRTDNVVFNEWNKRRFEFAFHANFGYPPNIEALKIISRWLEDKSGINLVIFGVNSRIAYKYIAPKTLRQNEIRIFGYIDNPYLILGNTKFYLAPIFKGTGIITKVLEAMASGAVPITTKFVALGIPELRQWPELIASNTSDWIGKAEKHLVGVYKLDYDAISKKLIDMTNKNYGYSANKLLLRNALEKLGYADRV